MAFDTGTYMLCVSVYRATAGLQLRMGVASAVAVAGLTVSIHLLASQDLSRPTQDPHVGTDTLSSPPLCLLCLLCPSVSPPPPRLPLFRSHFPPSETGADYAIFVRLFFVALHGFRILYRFGRQHPVQMPEDWGQHVVRTGATRRNIPLHSSDGRVFFPPATPFSRRLAVRAPPSPPLSHTALYIEFA